MLAREREGSFNELPKIFQLFLDKVHPTLNHIYYCEGLIC
jgi:hypothetical protein